MIKFKVMYPKYNVVSMGSRDYYQVPISLAERGCLAYLITDFYTGNLLSLFTKKRQVAEIDSKNTVSFIIFFLLQKIINFIAPSNYKLRFAIDFSFGFIAGFVTFVTTNRAVVYSYHIEGFVAFYKLVRKKPKHLVCFQVHPSPYCINKLIDEDLKKSLKIGYIKFKSDIEKCYKNNSAMKYTEALNCCDSIVCASSFTLKSIQNGLRQNIKTRVIPYGSKLDILKEYKYQKNPKIRLVSVCQVTQRKGMHWAFDAMKRSGVISRFEWKIVSNDIDNAIFENAPENVNFISNITDDQLKKLFDNSDLFVMPSLAEGFGLVYIEALSAGLPIVYTQNTGPSDFCVDGVHGFKVRMSCAEDLLDVFEKIADGRINLRKMRDDCKIVSKKITWERFRCCLYEFVMTE